MTNKFKALALLPILSLILTACTLRDLPVIGPYLPGGGPSEDPVTLTVWGLWEDPAVIDALVSKYNEERPNVTINYEDKSILELVEYKERVYTRAKDQSEVDIFLVHNSWVPGLSPYLSEMPSDMLDASTYSQIFYPVAYRSGVLNNKVYAVPAYYDGLVLVYNKAHFAEVGQTFPPTAWEEFRRLALELTIRTGEDGREIVRGGAAIGTANNVDHFSDILGLMFSQADVAIPNELDSVAAQDALSYFVNFSKQDRVWNDTMPEATSAFVAGEVSMVFVPSWQVIDILEAMPNIEDVGVAPVPQADVDNPVAWGSFWMYIVPSAGNNTGTAWDFINYIRQEDTQMTYFSEAAKVRPFGTPYSLVSLSNEVTSPVLRPVIETAPYARSAEIAARSGNRRQEQALRDAVNSVIGGGNSANAMSAAKSTIIGN